MNAQRKLNFGNNFEYQYSNDKYTVRITSNTKFLELRTAAERVEQALRQVRPDDKIFDEYVYTSTSGKFDVVISVKSIDRIIRAAEVKQQFTKMKLDSIYEDNGVPATVSVEDAVEEARVDLEETEEIMASIEKGLEDIKKCLKNVGTSVKSLGINVLKKQNVDLVVKMKQVKKKLDEGQRNLKANVKMIDENLREVAKSKYRF